MKKQIVSIVLAVSMLVSMLTAFMLPAVAADDIMHEALFTDSAIKVDGEREDEYLMSAPIKSIYKIKDASNTKLAFEGYALATTEGFYIFMEILGDTTYVNTNGTNVHDFGGDNRDYLQIYYNMSEAGKKDHYGYIMHDYNNSTYFRNQAGSANNGYTKEAPAGFLSAAKKTDNGWVSEMFIPWFNGTPIKDAMSAGNVSSANFRIGFQYNDDYNGDNKYDCAVYDKETTSYWSDYTLMPKIDFVRNFGRLSKTTVFLDGDISLSYNVNLGAEFDISKMYAKFTVTGLDGTTVKNVYGTLVDAAADKYNFSYGLAPHRMNDKVKVELVYDGRVIHSLPDYTVANFCIDTYNSSQADLGLTANQYEAMKDLVINMLNYGALAQEYKAYDVENLVNKGYEADIYSYDIVYDEIVKSAKTPGYDGTDFVSVNMYFDSASRLCFKVKTNDPENTVVSVYAGNGKSATVIPLVAENYNAEEDVYTVYTDIIDPANYDHNYIVRLEHVEDKGTDWESYEIIQSVKCSVNAYLAEMVARAEGSTDANTLKMAAFARAAYTLGVSARAMEAA